MPQPDHLVHVLCRMCKKIHRLRMSKSGWDAYQDGELIQRALPELSYEERELLISQTCGPCFDSLFADDGKDDDDTPVETGIDSTGFRE